MTSAASGALEPLQTTLAAEHAAVYAFGVLGGRTSQSAAPTLFTAVAAAYAAHRARRDRLTAGITELGGRPVAAHPAYDVPGRLDTPAQVSRTALAAEQSCAASYSWLVAQVEGDWRRWAAAALVETAVRQLSFGGAPEPFPGAADLA